MRSSLALVTVLGALALSGCTLVGEIPACSVPASFTWPVLRCLTDVPPVVNTAPPTPPPLAPEPEAPPPPPPPRVQVVEDRINLGETVQFETDSSKLLPQSQQLLDEVAGEIQNHPEITRVQIEGYTDNRASKKHNQTLSEQRASSVKAYLVSKGLKADRLVTKGFGEDRPVGDNATEDGRFKNRRVDFKILKRK